MKKILFAIMIICFTLSASTEISNMQAIYSSGLVKIQWNTGRELNVKNLIVEKSQDGVNFTTLSTEIPKGNNSEYLVLDKTLFGKTYLHYRVKIVDNDNTSTTGNAVMVNVLNSGITATWGSIKAMFR